MKCTKCGRETAEEGVFCGKCLDVMRLYPVKPGTVIQLPQRKTAPPKKPLFRKRTMPPEELVVHQKKTIRWLWVTLVCTALLLALSVILLLSMDSDVEAVATIGQNYITRNTTPH